MNIRRVVTDHDAKGRSIVSIDSIVTSPHGRARDAARAMYTAFE